jgi:hypothetical protein
MRTFVILLLSVVGLVTGRGQSAIDWFTIDAAGIPASSTNYLINDTLGQADAGTMSSANYQIVGGFWALPGIGPSLGTPIPPVLHIEFASLTQVRVWWMSPSTGFGLQSNPNAAAPAGWASYLGAVTDNGVRRSVLFPANSAPLFFRLRSP